MTDVFLVCFSTVIPESLENVSKKWIPKIMDYCIHNRGLPFLISLLVGTQIDLRQDRATLDKLADKNQIPISSKVWVKVAKQIGAAKYVECSAMTKEGLHGVDSIIDQACYERLKFLYAINLVCKCTQMYVFQTYTNVCFPNVHKCMSSKCEYICFC